MTIKKFRNISVDLEKKTFTIHEGSVGTYDYREIEYCKILYEEAKYKGKSSMFTHVLSRDSLFGTFFLQGNVWCGLRIEMRNGVILYTYISNQETQYNSLQFHDDTRKAEAFISFVRKHRVYFKNITFDTDYKTFSIAKGDVGTYSYKNITKCKIDIEFDSYYASIQQYADQVFSFENCKASVRIVFYMKDETQLIAYISNKPQDMNSRIYRIDNRIAQEVKALVSKIIKKYKEK